METIAPLSGLWCLAFLIIALGNVIQGMTGFGAALIAAPILAIFFAPKLVVIIVLVTSIFNLFFLAFHTRRHIDPKRFSFLLSFGIFGIPLGSYVLMIAPPPMMRLIIAIVSIVFSTLLLMGYSRRFKREVLASCGFGFVGGLLTASVAMGGPAIVLFLANQGWAKDIFRAVVALFFLMTAVLCLISHLFTGVTTSSRALIGLSLAPAGIIGFYLGDAVFRRMTADLFMKMALILILASGLASLAITLIKVL